MKIIKFELAHEQGVHSTNVVKVSVPGTSEQNGNNIRQYTHEGPWTQQHEQLIPIWKDAWYLPGYFPLKAKSLI